MTHIFEVQQMRLQLLLASVFIAPACANADIVLGNQPTLAGTSAIVGGTLDVRRAVGFTMDNQDFLLESVDISLNHEPTRSAPVVELYAGTSVGPSGSPLLTFNNPQMGLGNDVYSFLPPMPITLEAHDTYWVGVRALFPTVTGRFFWSGSHAGSTPVENFASYEGYRWEVGGLPTTVDSNNYGFQINGVTAVPEPSSFAMLGAVFGFAAIGRWKYRLRRDAKNIKENADGVV